jgi:hypothetical protein
MIASISYSSCPSTRSGGGLVSLGHGVLFPYRALVDMHEIHHEFSIVSEGLISMLLVRVLPLS